VTQDTSDARTLETAVEPPAERNLRINTISLILSSLVTGVLGLVFWGVAARLYPADEVGVAAAIISSAGILSTLSLLSIGRLYERFLPLAGTRTGPLLKMGLLVVSGTALLAGAGLSLLGPRHYLFETGWGMAWYPVLVLVLAVFALQDGATAGLGVAWWSAAKNAFHAAAKLVAVVVFVSAGSASAIVTAWGATAAAAAVFLLIAIRRRYRANARFLQAPNLPPSRELWSYLGSSFGLTAVWSIGPLAVPLIVVAELGPKANAYFAVAWAIVSALYFALHLVVSPYVAEVAAHPDKIRSLSWRLLQMIAVVAVVGSVGLVLAGPIVLNMVGAEYRQQGQALLYIAAVFIPVSAVSAVYEALARVHRKLKLMMVMWCSSAVVIVFGSIIGTRLLGVIGVGWVYLAAESLSTAVLIVPAVRWLRQIAAGAAVL
jgi:O-antigen/teichoic acid export membrane protein